MKIVRSYQSKSFSEFITYWQKLYTYSKEDLYISHIYKLAYTRSEIIDLYIWKNGMKLSARKMNSLEQKILTKRKIINEFKRDKTFTLDAFRNEFGTISAVWQIFLLHIIHPTKYPIYDQHIHRAYNYLHKKNWRKINSKMNKIEKENFYYYTYLNFIDLKNIQNLKHFDEAMFAFGRFINTDNNYIILES